MKPFAFPRNVAKREFLRSFTLVELMVTVLILTIILTAMLSILVAGNRLWQTDSVLGEIQAEARNGIDFMTKELYGAKIVAPDIGLSADNISFQLPQDIVSGEIIWSSLVQYAVNASGQLIRSQPDENDKIIAKNVSLVLFNYIESDALIINLTLQKDTVFHRPINFTVSAQVTLRN